MACPSDQRHLFSRRVHGLGRSWVGPSWLQFGDREWLSCLKMDVANACLVAYA